MKWNSKQRLDSIFFLKYFYDSLQEKVRKTFTTKICSEYNGTKNVTNGTKMFGMKIASNFTNVRVFKVTK